MIYPAGNMLLQEVHRVYTGAGNDVIVCYDKNSPSRTCYTLLVVKEHKLAKSMVHLFHNEQAEQYKGSYAFEEWFIFLFEYREKRPVDQFFMGDIRSLRESELLVQKLVLSCILMSGLPAPILYLVLTQNQVHIGRDNEIYFTYELNLEFLDEGTKEGSCVAACAKLIVELLEQRGKSGKSLELITRKLGRSSYHKFYELYRDLELTTVGEKKPGLLARLKVFFRRNRERLFHFLLVLCIVLVLLAVIAIISQLLFGDAVIYRILFRSFDTIGTEIIKGR